jgi:hypothetical protein
MSRNALDIPPKSTLRQDRSAANEGGTKSRLSERLQILILTAYSNHTACDHLR